MTVLREMVCGIALLSSGAVAAEAAFPALRIPDACGVQLKAQKNNDGAVDLDRIKALGFGFVRNGFKWDIIERDEKGVYDFSHYDEFVRHCEARKIRILGCLALGNKFYPSVAEPEGRAAYAKFAAATVAHFKGRGIMWEIWNEPNVQTFWGKRPGGHNSENYATEYVALVQAVVPLLRAADPDCLIMAGSVSNLWSASYQWQKFCFAQGILATGINAWSVHPYGFKKPEAYVDAYQIVRASMVADGKVAAPRLLLNSERGFPLEAHKEGAAGGAVEKAGAYQAMHLVRQYLVDLLCGVGLTNWYEWREEGSFDLCDAQGEINAAGRAAQVFFRELNGYAVAARLPLPNENDFLLALHNGERQKYVVWTAPRGDVNPDYTVPHAVTFAVPQEGEVEVTDLYGAKNKFAVADGKLTLTFTGEPQYIAFGND